MARDRKRAKQRQRRRQRHAASVPARRDASAEPAPDLTAPDTVRDAPPDPLAHASGDAEVAEAAEAIAELDGPTTPIEEDEYPQPDELEGADVLEDEAEPEEAEPDEAEEAEVVPRRRRAAAPGRELPREGNRFANFLRACWAELQRVQWPDRRQVAQATAVVLVFVLIAGGYLGLLDAIFSRLVNAIL
jgi:preprotein translocase subunit SecE